jgi:hypothetical protein
MRLKTIKTGFAVKVGDREGLHFSSVGNDYRDYFDIEAKFIDEIGECVVEITNRRTKAIAWTTFNNIVYAEPDLSELHTDTSQFDVKVKRGRPRKIANEETNP